MLYDGMERSKGGKEIKVVSNILFAGDFFTSTQPHQIAIIALSCQNILHCKWNNVKCTSTIVACGLAGGLFTVTRALGQEQ